MPGALTSAPYRSLNTPYKQMTLLPLVVDIGGTGAPTVNTTFSASGFTVTRGISGTYTATMPSGARALLLGTPSIDYATQLVGANQRPSLVSVDAISGSAGTFTFVTATMTGDTEGDYTVQDLANGDRITFVFAVEGG
jgi:hypothetical protein